MSQRLEGKVICVTGASGAIGAEIVRSILAQGAASFFDRRSFPCFRAHHIRPSCVLTFNAGARCSFCDIVPVDSLVAELSAKYPESHVMSHMVNVANEEQVAAWINATAEVISARFCAYHPSASQRRLGGKSMALSITQPNSCSAK